ncbi:MAG TPA: cytochrome ubiquinol oxidase subunit I, partial [Mycobacteriales bacterium]|nr:cytochrome ubiquinol oxidase subunit I [Mycobacteriales bacterium]
SYRFGEVATADDPWGYANSLEWATSCPPPRHNFTSMPRIRSERPAFELHYPHLVDRLEAEAHAGRKHKVPLAASGSTPGADADGVLGQGGRQGRNDPDAS